MLRMNEGIHPSPQPPPAAAFLTASFLEPRIQPGTVPDPCSAPDTCCQSHVLSLSRPPAPRPAHVLSLSPHAPPYTLAVTQPPPRPAHML